MTINNKLQCPQCGMTVEFVWLGTGPAVRHAVLKCPYDHFRVSAAYYVGSEQKVKNQLITRWNQEHGGSL